MTIVAIRHVGGQVHVEMLHGRQVRVLFGPFYGIYRARYEGSVSTSMIRDPYVINNWTDFPDVLYLMIRLASQPFLRVRDWWIAYLRVVPLPESGNDQSECSINVM